MTSSFWRAAALVLALATIVGCNSEPVYLPMPNEAQVAELRGGDAGGEEAGGEAAPVGEGWGTLKGQFVLAGGAPSLADVSTGGKDAPTCPASVSDDSLVVDSATGGIANVVIFLRNTSRIHPDMTEPSEEDLLFDQEGCVFLSHVTAIRVGRQMKILNSDPISHNTNISPPGDTAINPLLAGKAEAFYTFKRRQNAPVPVSCNIHPWMKAFVIPRDDPYIAVTKPDGTFEIANVPAGESLEWQVWHERSGNLAAQSGWRNGRFEIEVGADSVEDLGKIEVSGDLF